MFITLEGPEGSGKTSHLKPLAEWLTSLGHDIYVTREPGGTSIGEQIRQVIHDLKNTEMHPRTEALLYQAARAQIVEQELRPRLAAGEIVLCDRYFDSTLAYQGYGHQVIPLDELRQIIHFATQGLTPDLTILLDLEVEVGLARKGSQDEWNRLDAYTVDFHQRVRAGYHELRKLDPGRWVSVDAGQSWEAVQKELRTVILSRL
ncbi:MAG TPA: dTMP kinase [Anaerolineales bacterium]|jgi:dTMP kinase